MALIAVIGASRGIGLETVRSAIDAGHNVRAFARSADRIELASSKLERTAGDALSPEDVASAIDGVDTVVQTLGVPMNRQTLLGPVDLFSSSTRVLLDAMQQQKVRRLIAVTGFGAGDSERSFGCLEKLPFRLVLGRAYDDKSRQERMIRSSDIDWIIVRPTVLTNGVRTGRYRVLAEPGRWRNGFISRADVADFITQQICDDTYLRRAPALAY